MGLQNYMKDRVPFIAMVIVESGEVGMITLGKAAMNNGMSSLVYVVYYNSLGTLLLLPFFIFHSFRSNRPPLTLNLMFRFFLLGLLGICFLQIFAYAGINYSSPTLATAMGNLIPGFTFLLAVTFRILANSKPCPKCKRPIEKNQGCMHMICTPPCKFEF